MMTADRDFKAPDGGYGWVIVGACIILNSSLYPIILCFGMIYESKFTDMGVTATQISFLLHLNNSLMCTLGLFSGPLMKIFDYKQVTLIGTALCCLGIFLTSFATSYFELFCTVSVILGIGNGILMPGTYIAVNTYFEKKLTLAISFQVTGSCLVGIFMPQVCNYLLNTYGVQGTVLILAGISFHAIPAGMLLRTAKCTKCNATVTSIVTSQEKLEKNGVNEKLLSVYNTTTVATEKKESNLLEAIMKIFNFELFTERTYVIIVIGMGISFASELNTILMTSFVLIELAGFTRNDLAIATSLQAFTDLMGRLIVPFMAYRGGWSPKVTYAYALLGSSIGRTVLSLFYESKPMALTSVAILGLGKGSKAVFQSLILPKYVSFEKLASANGLLMVVNGILSLIVGPIIGLTHDICQSYVYTLHTATVLSMLCVVLWAVDYASRSKAAKLENVDSPT